MKSVKPVEVVTFPGTGFFSKPLMGSVIIRGNLMVDRVEHGEGERQSCFVSGPRSYPLPSLYLEPDRYETRQLPVGLSKAAIGWSLLPGAVPSKRT